MASAVAVVLSELRCSICMVVYRDPVTLLCGHNFCRGCITQAWDHQVHLREYKCPECQRIYKKRPEMIRNTALLNICEAFHATETDQEQTGIFCNYCDFPVPATKSCLQCETSLCDHHLRRHDRTGGHTLLPPTTDLGKRKCSVHKELLDYYCTEDAACVCVSCSVIGGHVGHKMMSLDEASEEKKKKLRNNLRKMMAETEEAEKRVQSLEELRRKAQEKAGGEEERVTALFKDIRRRLEELQKRILSDITRQVQSYDDIIKQLEIKKEELSRKMRHIEELCNMTDPLTFLQESDTGDLCDTEEEDRHDEQLHDGEDQDVAGISHTLHTGLYHILSEVTGGIYIRPADISLDVNTASNKLYLSDDWKTVSRSDTWQYHQETPERFQYPQVLSSQSFSSGGHYLEVDVGRSDSWMVGMCYPSIDRKGSQSGIGCNNKSWGLCRWGNHYSVRHNNKEIRLPDGIPSDRVGIFLDYEAREISFCALCDPVKTIHTFTATFTEPLHAALCVWGGCIKVYGGNQKLWEIFPLVTPQEENCNWPIVQPILASCL
ncbi:E3 ubiquitin/ISG15 ligase TRIM25-like [Hyperolius riggenbachi]|uniref:E3 ubiquitin/ISG15 ligase TRIM25-like n=1 Tax=Hyperolius riggenbachi TaxID=752182 RepID=UPI0035A314A9